MSNGIRATVELESQIRAEEGTQPSGGFAWEAMRRRDSRDGTGGTRGGWTALIRQPAAAGMWECWERWDGEASDE